MKSRGAALAGSALFLIAAPGTVAGLIPWWFTHWQHGAPFPGAPIPAALAILLGIAGALVLIDSFVRFAWEGFGTPAPAAPTAQLVVSGLYRHVRNPMYLAVTALILAQALWLSRPVLLGYATVIALLFHLFVTLYEEPVLIRRHGSAYARYRANVPRWLPRLRPWTG